MRESIAERLTSDHSRRGARLPPPAVCYRRQPRRWEDGSTVHCADVRSDRGSRQSGPRACRATLSGICSTWPSPASATTSNTAASASWSSTWIRATVRPPDPAFEVRQAPSPTTSRGSRPRRHRPALRHDDQAALAAFDLATDKVIWDRAYDGGCDRLAVSPDGKTAVRAVARRAALERHRCGDAAT